MSWVVVVTQPNVEMRVADYLHQKGFVTYYPLAQKQIIKRHKVMIITYAAFSRYLFLSIPCHFEKLVNTPGLEAILKNDGKYAIIPNKVVSEIRHHEKDGFFDTLPNKPFASKGDIITLDNTLKARVLEMVDKTHARVIVKLFNSYRPATVTVN